MQPPSPIPSEAAQSDSGDDTATVEFAELRPLLSCDGPFCQSENPGLRCTDCHMVYYCSAHCQGAHWTSEHHMHCASWSRAANELVLPLPDKISTTTMCGLCCRPTVAIRRPVLLSNCNHAFCFACIAEFQGKSFVANQEDEACRCPTCGTQTNGHVVNETVKRAHLYIAKAQRLCKTEASLRQECYRLADVEIQKVLKQEPMHLGALWAKAQRWQEEDPPVAIEIYHSIFKIDRKGMAATLVEELERRLETGLVDDEDMLAVEELMERERQKYRDDERDQLSVLDAGKGATRLWNLHLGLIKAYRRAGRPADAYRACLRVLKDESKGQSDHDVMTLRYISYELSKSSLRLGEFEEAIQVAHHLLVADRSMPGVHKVVATALLALDQERQEENVSGEVVVEMESDGYVYYANLDCAIEVMYEGFAYEEHWNDRNTYTNREFLKLLCDLNGVEVTVTHFETQQPERATNRWKEKRRSRKRK